MGVMKETMNGTAIYCDGGKATKAGRGVGWIVEAKEPVFDYVGIAKSRHDGKVRRAIVPTKAEATRLLKWIEKGCPE